MKPFDYQSAALTEIVARARAFFAGQWRELHIQPRWHSILVAPSGVGKTTLAKMAAAAEGVHAELRIVSVPGWIPTGSTGRTVAETIATLAEAVARNKRTFLVLDELDKATSAPTAGSGTSTSSWQQHCLLEVLQLLDGRWPTGLKSPEDANENEIPTDVLTEKLRTSVFILCIGTFQDYFDSPASRRTIGFGAPLDAEPDEISGDDLLEKLPRELLNRINLSLIRIPDLQAEHYYRIAQQAEDTLPERLRDAFRAEVNSRIGGAIHAKQGVRFLEGCIMEVVKNLPPEMDDIAIPTTTSEPDPFDLCL